MYPDLPQVAELEHRSGRPGSAPPPRAQAFLVRSASPFLSPSSARRTPSAVSVGVAIDTVAESIELVELESA
jgi:hypothetical protein